jgi:hypothetical protein
MVVFEDIIFKVFKLLVAERTSVMPVYSLLNAALTIDMSTPRNVTIIDRIETNCTLKLDL